MLVLAEEPRHEVLTRKGSEPPLRCAGYPGLLPATPFLIIVVFACVIIKANTISLRCPWISPGPLFLWSGLLSRVYRDADQGY